MPDNPNVNNIFNNVKENFNEELTFERLQDLQMAQLKKELIQKYNEYQTTIRFMAADAPLEILGLSPAIQNLLLAHGCFRIYDLFNCDFTKVKGLGPIRLAELTACFDQFLSML